MGRTAVAMVAALLGVPGRAGADSVNVLASFHSSNGAFPVAGLILDADGNLYGTTENGGSSGYGTVYEAVRSGSSYTINTLASFNSSNGAYPSAGLIMDAGGNLYGTTNSGGANNDGTVFEAVRSGSSYTLNTLASFNASNGAFPLAGLIVDAGGNLYGATYFGGSSGYGTVYEAVRSGSSYTINTLASFNASNGAYPSAGLIMDAGGNLYGTTQYGASGYGTVYEAVRSGSSYTINTLASFNSTNGSQPSAGLIMDASGNLYGTAYYGGANGYGTVFEAVKSGSSYIINTLVTFNSSNGANPFSGLIVDAGGNLYGTTQYGGANGYGTVFEAVKSGSSYTIKTLASFNSSDGAYPSAGLINDAAGNLYGTTSDGGANNDGTVFEVPAAAVPEPSTWVMALVSIATVGAFAWKTRGPRAARA